MRARGAGAAAAAAGVKITSRRIDWKGQSGTLRIPPRAQPPRGGHIDWHGGGWTIGAAAIDDDINIKLAKAGLAVVSVDYDMMPTVTLAQMLAQSEAAADWVFDNAEKEFGARPIFIGGESAGAHLAA